MYTSTLISVHFLIVIILGFLSWYDIRTQRVPRTGIFALLGIAFLWIPFTTQSFALQAIGAIGMGLFFWGIGAVLKYSLHKPTLGFGDVQLWAVLSLFLKIQDFPFFILLTGLVGFCNFLIYRKSSYLPFVPSISLAFLITFWFK